jgi:hypothetical protein
MYHPMPLMGFFHLPFIASRASRWVPSPPATASLKCLSCALITSSAVSPRNAASHGPPICLHVIVFVLLTSISEPTECDGEPRSTDEIRGVLLS